MPVPLSPAAEPPPGAASVGTPVTVWLIRHPAPAIAPGVCYGQLDVGLAEPVEQAVQDLRAELPHPLRVFSSPLSRCRQLATALDTDPVFDARLAEMHFGEWEGRRWDEIGREALDLWAADPLGHAPPGGEAARAMAARVVSFAADFSSRIKALGPTVADRKLAIVAHQGPLRVLAAHWHGEPESAWLDRQFAFARATPCVVTV
jgi:alpha-ribazole phosphatase